MCEELGTASGIGDMPAVLPRSCGSRVWSHRTCFVFLRLEQENTEKRVRWGRPTPRPAPGHGSLREGTAKGRLDAGSSWAPRALNEAEGQA